MSKCPVCDTQLNTPICPECGFDLSRHYEAYPTFGPIPAADAVSRRRDAREAARGDVIRCAKCGGTSFALQAGTMLPVCRRCGAVFTLQQPEPPQPKPVPKAPEPEPIPEPPKPEPPKAPSIPSTGITAVAGGFDHAVVLYADGRVAAVGNNDHGQCITDGWTDISAIAAARNITVGLKKDGTVVAVGDDRNGLCRTESWRNITAIAVSPYYVLGLAKDQTMTLNCSINLPELKLGVQENNFAQLLRDKNLSDMLGALDNRKTIAAGHRHIVLLRSDGTVVAYGDNSQGQCNVSKWTDIVAIAAGEAHTVGLKRDGTVVTAGRSKEGQRKTVSFLLPWRNITAIAAGDNHTVALRSDGTVLCCGSNSFGKCDTQKWTNVKSIAAGALHTLGLKEDGTLLAAGYQAEGILEEVKDKPFLLNHADPIA